MGGQDSLEEAGRRRCELQVYSNGVDLTAAVPCGMVEFSRQTKPGLASPRPLTQPRLAMNSAMTGPFSGPRGRARFSWARWRSLPPEWSGRICRTANRPHGA